MPGPQAVTVTDITDLTAAGAGMDLLEQDAMPLLSMPLRARRVVVRLGSATVVYQSSNLRIRTRTSVQERLLAYVTFGPRATGNVEGLCVRPGMMLVAESGAQAGFVVDPDWESIAVLVPVADVRAHLAVRRPETAHLAPVGVEVVRTDPAMARALFRWGSRLVSIASRTPELFEAGRPERDAAHAELLERLFLAMREADTVEPVGRDKTLRDHTEVVRIAEEHALSHLTGHVHVTDLCRIANVSERTLEGAFKEVMGLTPVAYLIRLRLHRVRAALLAAEPGTTTVSAEALKWGFWHFGEFSRAYKRCFGELPSASLRRPPPSIDAASLQESAPRR
jgi:AraC-like DNA-binding protein